MVAERRERWGYGMADARIGDGGSPVPDVDAQDETPPPIIGCMTGASPVVALKIADAAVSDKTRRFLIQVLVASFSTAGYQQREGRRDAGLVCQFDLAAWAVQH